MDAYTFVRMNWLRPDTNSVPSCSRPGDRGSAACAGTTEQAPIRTVDRHEMGRDVLLGEKCTSTTSERSIRRWRDLTNGNMNGQHGSSRTNGSRTSSIMNHAIRSFVFLMLTPERFHVLLNCLFKVLFNFHSRYLIAIGLVVAFSLRWNHHPLRTALTRNPNIRRDPPEMRTGRYGPVTLCGLMAPVKMDFDAGRHPGINGSSRTLQFPTPVPRGSVPG